MVLLHDFPDFLCHFSFGLLEEIPDQFMQVKNIMVSAYPKGMRIPDPFDQEHLGGRIESSEEYNKLPTNNPRIEDRINCYNLQVLSVYQESDRKLHQKLRPNGLRHDHEEPVHPGLQERYSCADPDIQINKNLLDSFVLYVPYFVFSKIGLSKTRTRAKTNST